MSLEYDLYISLPDGLERTAGLMASLPGFRREGPKFEGPGVTGRVCAVSETRRRILEEELKVRADVCVGFRLSLAPEDDTAEGYRGTRTVVDASLALLARVPADAVLLLNGEYVVLGRFGGELRLNRDERFWDERRLAWLSVPYELAEF